MMGSMIVIYEYDISTNMDGYSSAFLDYNIYIIYITLVGSTYVVIC